MAQILHLREAEKKFPPQHHSNVYINAIKTEGEAAEYIRHVTATIHRLHEEAAPRVGRVTKIAAAAAPKRLRTPKTKSTVESKKIKTKKKSTQSKKKRS